MIAGITDTLLMIRPKNFGPNAETQEDNAFQCESTAEQAPKIIETAIREFDEMVAELRRNDIEVIVVEDTDAPVKPDAIFPNNWFTTHENGSIVTYPMMAPSRQAERREDIIEQLSESQGYKKRYGFEYHEAEEQYLEGTGSMVLDRVNKIVYACLSQRSEIKVLEKFAVLYNYHKIVFHAVDQNGDAIYHTNVLMAMGVDYVVICLETLTDEVERAEVIASFKKTGKEIIDISTAQLNAFAGNMLQVRSKLGEPFLVMSESAYKSLNINQIDRLLSHNKIISTAIPTIEKYGGGSVRCMIAEIFATK